MRPLSLAALAARALFVALAASASMAGCAYDRVTQMAARDLECASGKLDVQRLEGGRTLVNGCGRDASYFCSLDVRGIETCVREQAGGPLRIVQLAAARDLGCEPSQIKVREESEEAFEAKGCHQRALYRCSDSAAGLRCRRAPSVTADDP